MKISYEYEIATLPFYSIPIPIPIQNLRSHFIRVLSKHLYVFSKEKHIILYFIFEWSMVNGLPRPYTEREILLLDLILFFVYNFYFFVDEREQFEKILTINKKIFCAVVIIRHVGERFGKYY